jgi:hypothetical protein
MVQESKPSTFIHNSIIRRRVNTSILPVSLTIPSTHSQRGEESQSSRTGVFHLPGLGSETQCNRYLSIPEPFFIASSPSNEICGPVHWWFRSGAPAGKGLPSLSLPPRVSIFPTERACPLSYSPCLPLLTPGL